MLPLFKPKGENPVLDEILYKFGEFEHVLLLVSTFENQIWKIYF